MQCKLIAHVLIFITLYKNLNANYTKLTIINENSRDVLGVFCEDLLVEWESSQRLIMKDMWKGRKIRPLKS